MEGGSKSVLAIAPFLPLAFYVQSCVVRKLVLTRRDFHPAWPHVAPFEVEYTRPLTETVLLGHEIEALTVSLPSHVSNQSPPFLN